SCITRARWFRAPSLPSIFMTRTSTATATRSRSLSGVCARSCRKTVSRQCAASATRSSANRENLVQRDGAKYAAAQCGQELAAKGLHRRLAVLADRRLAGRGAAGDRLSPHRSLFAGARYDAVADAGLSRREPGGRSARSARSARSRHCPGRSALRPAALGLV